MKKVITYGSYDLLHYGHLRLLERAKALGDYLIVGVTSDDYDKTRGKINLQQTLTERIEAVKKTGLADMVIVEEYEGQKIDDIKRYGVDIFAIGSDWEGKFDYLNEYCKVKYLPRTEGVSSSQIRAKNRQLTIGLVGESMDYFSKMIDEDKYVNGIEIVGIYTNEYNIESDNIKKLDIITRDYDTLLQNVDGVYIKSKHEDRYWQIKRALEMKKNVLCESPMTLSKKECKELYDLAEKNGCILMEAIRTAYSTAYSRLLLLLKAGKIGNILSVDSTCTSMKEKNKNNIHSLYDWGSNALLPIFQILGTNYVSKDIISSYFDEEKQNDRFTKINFLYKNATASIKVAEGAKAEGDLVITGTDGYIYVPSPWWKTDYFEVRYEDQANNKRYFYQLDGEGIRYELLAFARAIEDKKQSWSIDQNTSLAISKIMEDFKNKIDCKDI